MDHTHHHHHENVLSFLSTLDVSRIDTLIFFSILNFSFFASLHCLSMCGPFVCLKMSESHRSNMKHIALYNFGRFLSYVGMGVLLGELGRRLQLFSPELSKVFSLVLGLFFIFLGLFTFRFYQRHGFRVTHDTWPIMSYLRKRINDSFLMFLLGLVTVFLPCMTLTPVLGLSLGSGSPLSGGLVLFAFFLGTLPMMSMSGLITQFIISRSLKEFIRPIGSIFFILAGAASILRIYH